jgi:ribosomal protein S12 methylthiotransferase
MAGLAHGLGLELVAEPTDADVILVNTCGFILPAKEESIGVVLELAALKKKRRRGRGSRPGPKLVVAGCLVQRYREELAGSIPEVDHLVGTGELEALRAILQGEGDGAPRVAPPSPGLEDEGRYERVRGGPPHVAYLKIAEGCDRPCAFCTIPAIRGPQRSRAPTSLVEEAASLVEGGARELVLVAQDTTAYGLDLAPPGAGLVGLLEALSSAPLPGLLWIRVLYAYPSSVDRALVEAIAALPRVVPYLDLPLQHIDDGVLRRMKRGYTGRRVREVIARLRARVPDIALRGTLLVGHPGETEEAHRALVELVDEGLFDHLGVFAYSDEEGTAAAAMAGRVPEAVAEERRGELLEHQRASSRGRLAAQRGRVVEVLVDGESAESEYLMEGRTAGQAPEVDGVVHLADCEAGPGELVRARVTGSADYDLVATVVERAPA